ncbi:efflux RND transporter periplasmic adaptor subunit [Aquabacterium sp.]|uniref:efflux RND transporter periplasmic adaptor subunit n=1 Tax=Aquabacterium sp. TaxID=1872578 RepID=UPI0024899C1C|nr:efflux RND transporter periplasmic adaptor subunit [Aquabacterium sp.]MDI1349898.1 efflux RND transporter periplasmic adaptor subunit [Aquabacterium sp.]
MFSKLSQGVRQRFGQGLASVLACVAVSAGAAAPAEGLNLTAQQVAALGVTSVPLSQSAQGGLTVPAQLRLPAQQQQVLAAPVSGLVTAIQADTGAQVRQGQWLVRLRSTQAQALRRDALQAGSQQELAERSLQRDEQLMSEGLIAQSRLDQSRTQARVARLTAQQQQQAVGQALGSAQVSPNGEITLVAPMSGQVAELMVSVGQRVEEAAPLLKLANLQELSVELQVPVQQAQGLQAGQTVQVLLAGGSAAPGSGELVATVVSIAPLLDERTQSVTVRARLRQTASGSLRPGQWVQARLQTSSALPLLPESAIVTLSASGEQAVFIEEAPGRYRLQKVKTLGRQGSDMVVQGLPETSAGAAPLRIVTRGTAALKALLKP